MTAQIGGSIERFVSRALGMISGATGTELALGIVVLFILVWLAAVVWGVRNPVPTRNYRHSRW